MLVSGMIIGTLFTLFVLPSIYYFLAKNHTKWENQPTDSEERKLEPALV
jgi:predicted RND superfamily exporter protein